MEPHATTLTYKEFGWTVSMCQLIALSGIVAIAYANHDNPVADLQALFEHINECAESLRIDPGRIGVIIRQGLIENLPMTFVNHPEGPHGFDLFDDSRTSRDIVRLTLRFLRQHLMAEG